MPEDVKEGSIVETGVAKERLEKLITNYLLGMRASNHKTSLLKF